MHNNNNNNNNNNKLLILLLFNAIACEDGDATVLWNQAVHRDREVTENGPDTECGRRNAPI